MSTPEPCCTATHTPEQHGYTGEKDAYLARLRRIEGQIRGLQRMISEDTYCVDIVNQVSAATSALHKVGMSLLDDHLHHCVANAIARGGTEGDDTITEAMQAIARMTR